MAMAEREEKRARRERRGTKVKSIYHLKGIGIANLTQTSGINRPHLLLRAQKAYTPSDMGEGEEEGPRMLLT